MPTKLVDPKIKRILETYIFPDLIKGRKDFDLPHTKAVIHWMEWLITNYPQQEHLNSKVLITAAYAHDWGYIGLFDGANSNDPQVIFQKKEQHMMKGAEKIGNLIDTQLSRDFTAVEKKRVIHLVLVHDRVENLLDEDELLLMEADTLGILDVERVKPTFSQEDNQKYLASEIERRRLPAFTHQFAKKMAAKLVEKRKSYYKLTIIS